MEIKDKKNVAATMHVPPTFGKVTRPFYAVVAGILLAVFLCVCRALPSLPNVHAEEQSLPLKDRRKAESAEAVDVLPSVATSRQIKTSDEKETIGSESSETMKRVIRFSIVFLLFLSLALNVTVYFFEISPLISRYFARRFVMSPETGNEAFEVKVVEAGLRMLRQRSSKMPFRANSYFPVTVYRYLKRLLYGGSLSTNYPRAILAFGLAKYYEKTKDARIFEALTNYYHNALDDTGHFKFPFDKVDQCLFGLSLMSLERITGKAEYKNAVDRIYRFLADSKNEFDVIPYRPGTIHLSDTLGMVCPFLYMYGYLYQDPHAVELANKQLDYHIKYGLDASTRLPFHGIDMDSAMHFGPAEWGRGIGWYLMGLSFAVHFTTPETNPPVDIYAKELKHLETIVNKLKTKEGYWTQFVVPPRGRIDTSTTSMFFFLFSHGGMMQPRDDFLGMMKKYTLRNGEIGYCSGDTIAVNQYSAYAGVSELSQGMTIAFLSLP